MFYDLPLMRNYRSAMVVMPPFMVQGSVSAAAANAAGNPLNFPNAYTVNAAQLLANPTLQAFQYNAKNTYAYRWSLTIQREFSAGWVTSVGYTGARALHLWVQEEPNINRWQGWPNQPTGRKFWPAITGVNPINPAWSTMRFQLPFGNSYYQGLALMAQKRMSYGFQVQAAYTWSKAIDQGAGLTGGRFPQSQREIYAWDTNLKKSLSVLDIRNNLSMNFSFEPPRTQGLTGITALLSSGWQLNGIVTLSSGHPLSVLDSNRAQRDRIGSSAGLRMNLKPGGDNNPVLGGPELYYDPSQFEPSELGFFGTLGRNTLIGPGIAVFDGSVFKTFRLTENQALQFRSEFFNLFNRVNLNDPDVTPLTASGARDANAGRISGTRTTARQIQFALKYTF
jgi:hypothetical protein